MRYVLLICVCAIAMPEAFAAPRPTSGATSGKQETGMRPAKHKLESARHKPSRSRQNRSLGGIHPLVGSGDY
jgi:hypothetical protein